ncbi:MAG: IS21 family transposase [Candidatus Caldatribacteriota bacterium]|nr:IS21 family transposase [Candidatus Caldatribacteriota bacterium]
MIGVAMYITIKSLWEKHKNKSLIARLTGHDWKTVSQKIKEIETGKEYPKKKLHPRILDSYQEQIVKWLEDNLSGVRIHEKMQENGIKVGYSTVKDYICKIKRRDNIFIRMHTLPGEEAQVDFGYVGYTLYKGKKRKTWVFNMRLSYSRLDYYEVVYDQRVETFIRCHINAFRYFGGIPQYIKIDNLKSAILQANFYEPIYQELYKNFASHYGFHPLPCRVRRPNDKGKVESGIKYVKINFFSGRKFTGEKDLKERLFKWYSRANQRIHGTTRKVPQEVFKKEEKAKLIPLPQEEFKLVKVGIRKVYHDCHIYVDYNYYSVPFKYVGRQVEIELSKKLLKVYCKGKEITVHPRLSGRGNFSTNNSHYPTYKRYSDTEYQEKYQKKMADIGAYAEQLFFPVLKEHPRDWNRTIQGILSLRKTYPDKVIEAACRRALSFGVTRYSVIKNICHNGSYLMPVEFEKEATCATT